MLDPRNCLSVVGRTEVPRETARPRRLPPRVRRSPRMRIRYTLAVVLMLLLVLAAVATATTGFVSSLNGLQEVPANASPGTGTAVYVLDNTQTSLSYSVT